MQSRDWSCGRSGASHLQLDRILRRASKMPCVMAEIAWPQHWSHQRPLGGAKEVLDVPPFEAQVEQAPYHSPLARPLVLVPTDCWLIARHAFGGKCKHATTEPELAQDLRHRFGLQPIVFVVDRGMIDSTGRAVMPGPA